ncbi:MAG: ABC transporter transmembrane domain-containing protein [Desulfomonilaceae bacterium]
MKMERGGQGALPAGEVKKSELSIVLQSFRNTFVAVGLFSFVLNMLLMVPAMYMLQIYDRVLQSRNQDTLLMLTLIMLFMYVLFGFLYWVRSQILIRLGNQMDQRLSGKVFQSAFSRSLRLGSVNATQSLNDLTAVRQFLTGQGLLAFFDFPWTPIFIAVIYYLHPLLGIFSICSTIFLMALAMLNEFASRKPLAEASTFYRSANAYAGANLRNAEAIEAMGMLEPVRGFWYGKHEAFLKLQALASEPVLSRRSPPLRE